jgi:hypothetical protein
MGRFTVIRELICERGATAPRAEWGYSKVHPKVRDVRLRREAAAPRRTKHERSGKYRKIREKFPNR